MIKLYSDANNHKQRAEQWKARIENMEGIQIPYAFSNLAFEVGKERISNKGKYNAFIGYTKGWLLGVVTGDEYAAENLPNEEGGNRSVSKVDMPQKWWEYAIKAGKGGRLHDDMPEPIFDKDGFYEYEKSLIYDRMMPAYRAIRESFKSRPWYQWFTNHAQYTAERDAMNAIRGMLITLAGSTKAEFDEDYIQYCGEVTKIDNDVPEVDVEEQEQIKEESKIYENVNVKEPVEIKENADVKEDVKNEEDVKNNENVKIDENVKNEENVEIKEEIKIDENVNVKESIKIEDDNDLNGSVRINEGYWAAKQRKKNEEKKVVVVKTAAEKTEEIVYSKGFDKAFTQSGERLMSKMSSILHMDRRELVQRFNDVYPQLMDQMKQDAVNISQAFDACNSAAEKKNLIQECAKDMFVNTFINLDPIDLPIKERLIVAQIFTNYMMSSATPACFEAKEYGKIAKDAAFKSRHFLEEVVEDYVYSYMIEDLNDTISSAIADSSQYEEKNIVVNIDDEIEKQSFIADGDDNEVSRSVLK